MNRRMILAGLASIGLGAARAAAEADRASREFRDVPSGQWTRIHRQSPGDETRFVRQAHAGSIFDPKRGHLVVFGSDTHGKDWTNTPLIFDLSSRRWSRPYRADHPDTYSVSDEGVPLAGKGRNHPWAMHTFGALAYDPGTDRLIVSSYPAHLQPGRFTDAMAALWPRIVRHPTWTYSLASGEWQPLNVAPVHFFAYFTVFDRRRGVVVGYRPEGIFELDRQATAWRQVRSEGLVRYHTNGVFDDRLAVILMYGGTGFSNEVVLFEPETGRHMIMPTPGLRPPGDQHVPLAFHSGRGELIALVDRFRPDRDPTERQWHSSETWGYDARRDAWSHYESAKLPFAQGMNYNLEYDPLSEILILVTSAPGESTSMWALRL